MNKEHKLDKKNTDEGEKTMMKLMEHFEEWMKEKEACMKPQPKLRPRSNYKRDCGKVDGPDSNKKARRESAELPVQVVKLETKGVVEEDSTGERSKKPIKVVDLDTRKDGNGKRKRKGDSQSEKKVKKRRIGGGTFLPLQLTLI